VTQLDPGQTEALGYTREESKVRDSYPSLALSPLFLSFCQRDMTAALGHSLAGVAEPPPLVAASPTAVLQPSPQFPFEDSPSF
jgi:hypothetical protein